MENVLIERLRALDTASLSDALDSLGVSGGLEGIVARAENYGLCGRAFTVEFGDPTEAEAKEGKAADYIDEVSQGEVVVLANNGRTDCTVWGGILTHQANMKGLGGTIIDGACRDLEEVLHYNYPLYTKAVFMQTGKGRTRRRRIQVPVYVSGKEICPGDYLRGDRNGVVVIPQALIEETLRRAEAILTTEDKIVHAVVNGERLDEARKKYHYSRPWEVDAV